MKQLIRRLSKVADSSSVRYEQLRSCDQGGGCNDGNVLEGHVPVYVGEEKARFEIRAELLNHPIFSELLKRSAQEYGYEQRGVLRIPCPVRIFERVLSCVIGLGGADVGVDVEIVEFFGES